MNRENMQRILRLGTIHPASFCFRLEQNDVVFTPGDALAREVER